MSYCSLCLSIHSYKVVDLPLLTGKVTHSMEVDLYSQLLFLGRFVVVALLFISAGAILVVNRPQWTGSWLLLTGAILASALAAIRVLGMLPSSSGLWGLLAFEAAETVSYVLAGTGILLVSIKSRTTGDEAVELDLMEADPA